uniref:RRM domain-containing protein n=1 Tax=Parastrongyloides trichosuri TaxID=131310 RepID=A0A0N4ZNV4_PARTI
MSRYNLFFDESNCSRDDRTVYVRNLDNRVTSEILWELFSQVGNVKDVYLPPLGKDKNELPFALVTFKTIHSPIFASEMLSGISLFGRPISVQPKGKSMHSNLFMELKKSGKLAFQIESDMMRRDMADTRRSYDQRYDNKRSYY